MLLPCWEGVGAGYLLLERIDVWGMHPHSLVFFHLKVFLFDRKVPMLLFVNREDVVLNCRLLIWNTAALT